MPKAPRTLYDRKMAVTGGPLLRATRGVLIHTACLTPTPQRLLRLVEDLPRAGIDLCAVCFGETFPWSLDRRFTAERAYSEDFMVIAHRTAIENNMVLIPELPLFVGMSPFLAHAAYAHMRRCGDVDALDCESAGAVKFAEDLLDDLLSLLPDLRTVLIRVEPFGGTGSSEGGGLREAETELLERTVSTLADRGVSSLLRFTDLESQLPVGTDRIRAHTVDLAAGCCDGTCEWGEVDVRSFAPDFCDSPRRLLVAIPPAAGSIEYHMDRLVAAFSPDSRPPEACESLSGCSRLREQADRLGRLVDDGWKNARRAREELVSAGLRREHREHALGVSVRLIKALQESMVEFDSAAAGLAAGLRDRVHPDSLREWLSRQGEPLREELALLQARLRQLPCIEKGGFP